MYMYIQYSQSDIGLYMYIHHHVHYTSMYTFTTTAAMYTYSQSDIGLYIHQCTLMHNRYNVQVYYTLYIQSMHTCYQACINIGIIY